MANLIITFYLCYSGCYLGKCVHVKYFVSGIIFIVITITVSSNNVIVSFLQTFYMMMWPCFKTKKNRHGNEGGYVEEQEMEEGEWDEEGEKEEDEWEEGEGEEEEDEQQEGDTQEEASLTAPPAE